MCLSVCVSVRWSACGEFDLVQTRTTVGYFEIYMYYSYPSPVIVFTGRHHRHICIFIIKNAYCYNVLIHGTALKP